MHKLKSVDQTNLVQLDSATKKQAYFWTQLKNYRPKFFALIIFFRKKTYQAEIPVAVVPSSTADGQRHDALHLQRS